MLKSLLTFIILLVLSLQVMAQEDHVIRKVKFKGNKQFLDSRLSDEVTIQSSNWFKEKLLRKEPVYFTRKLYNDDIERIRIFYQREGYLDLQFGEPEIVLNKKNKVKITIYLDEGEPIKISDVNFLVDSTLQLDDVLRPREKRNVVFKTETTTSRTFRDEAITNDKLAIAETFYNLGYPYTKVDHKLEVDTSTNTTKVDWSIDRGPLSYFGPTNIVGNERVPTKSILRQISYDEGDVWSKQKIEDTQKQIYNQGNYRVASVRSLIGPEKSDTLPMRIQISEAPRWIIRFGVGYGSEDKFRAFTDIHYLSFLTNTGRLNFYAKHSDLEPYNIYLKFSQPSFLFPMNTLSIHPFMQRQNEPGYKLAKVGYNVTFWQNFSEELSTSIGFVYEDIEIDTPHAASVSLPQEPSSIYKKTGIVLGGIYNNSDPILDPVSGYAISSNFKTNDLLFQDEMPFYRFLVEFKTYFGIQKGLVMALRAKIGGIRRTDGQFFIPVEERFYAGGSHSVRGWGRSQLGPKDEDDNPIGGTSLFETSAEFRLDIGRKIKFVLFTDAGNVWLDPFDTEAKLESFNFFSYDFADLRYAAGAGLKIKTPIGPTGIEVARPIFDSETSWQIHFNIGHTF